MNYYEIRDRIPCEEIDALTVESARVWLERNGWTLCDSTRGTDVEYEDWWRGEGNFIPVTVSPEKPRDHGQRMVELVSEVAWVTEKRVATVIAEIRAIAEWQKRCKEWVPPADKCDACWVCIPSDLLREVPRFIVCPTCSNKRCPRATDHRNECSGSNEPGQEGSRYA